MLFWIAKYICFQSCYGNVHKVKFIEQRLFYGYQSWTILNTVERKLSINETKILRKIYGP
jgi:hypothetical protein